MARAERQRALASGAQAESLAAAFLESNGRCVVARSVRSRFGEIDLVCRDGDTLVFVEVRLRRSPRYGGAAASITAAKRARLVAACESYLATLQRTPACRIDAILVDALDARRIEWMRDAVSV
jgi:putative endonuclease